MFIELTNGDGRPNLINKDAISNVMRSAINEGCNVWLGDRPVEVKDTYHEIKEKLEEKE